MLYCNYNKHNINNGLIYIIEKRKIMKKILSVAVALSCILLLISCSNDAPEEVVTGDIVEIAEEYVTFLLDGKYDEAYNNYVHDKTMKKAVNPEVYSQIMVSIEEFIGDVVTIHPSYKEQVEQYMVVSFPIEGSLNNTNLNVVFDSNSYIAGFNMGEFKTSGD